MKRYKRVSGAIPTERQKEEESTLKKKLTPKSIIVAALALILAASMFGCSKDTTAAEDKTEKTVSTEKVETVQEKAEEPTAELLSSKDTEDTGTGTKLRPPVMPETAQKPEVIEVNPNFDYAAIYADLCENHPDTASAMGGVILCIPNIFDKESAADLFEEYLSNTEHDPAAAPGLVDYLLEKQSSDSTTSTNTSTNTDNTNTTTSNPTTNTNTNTNTNTATSKPTTNTSTSQPSTNTSTATSKPTTNTTTSKPSTNTSKPSTNTNTSTSQPSDSSSDDDWDRYMQNAADLGWDITGDYEMKYGETIDASNATVADWAGGEVIFGENGTITVIRP